MVLNLFQAYFTELFHDEAYYWFYSRKLALGYQDHPPAIAMLIAFGYSLFQNEFGVRLLTVVMNTIAIGLLSRMSNKENHSLFFTALFSMIVTHFSGFLAVPDAPFFFFTVCFFLGLKIYIESDTLPASVLLGIIIAGLLYSKYHGGMPVFFAVLSMPKVVFRKSFWIVFMVALLLYSPHLWWMYVHDFGSLKFHLVYRIKAPWDISRLFNYLGGLLLITGPLTGWLFLYSAGKYKVKNEWENALKYCFVGILFFLLLLSFQTHIEANWAASALVPMILLAYKYLYEKPNLQRWLRVLAFPSFGLIVIVRVFLIWNFLPAGFSFPTEFHGWKKWAKEVEVLSEGNPVVFSNSYQLPSKYMFYSGKKAWAASNLMYHRTQFDFSDSEVSIQGKKVLYYIRWNKHGVTPYHASNGYSFYYKWIENYRSYSKVSLYPQIKETTFRAGTQNNIKVLLKNGYGFPVNMGENLDCLPKLMATFLRGDKVISTQKEDHPISFTLQDTVSQNFSLKIPDTPGEYYMIFSFSQCEDFTMNGFFQKITVE